LRRETLFELVLWRVSLVLRHVGRRVLVLLLLLLDVWRLLARQRWGLGVPCCDCFPPFFLLAHQALPLLFFPL
jgi:hypothetical protein